MITVTRAELFPYALPLSRPLLSARGRFSHRFGWLLALDDDADRRGWGDAATFPGFGASRDGADGRARLERELGELGCPNGGLVGERFSDLDDIARWRAARDLAPEVAHAVELALLDIFGQTQRVPIARLLSPEPAETVASHALVFDEPDRRAHVLKIKAGARSLDADLARVARVRATSAAGAMLRLDAGGAWTADEAARAIEALAVYRIAVVEQPIAPGQLAACAELRRQCRDLGILLALDEDVTSLADIDAIAAAGAADVVVIKPMFAGGLLPAREMVERARHHGLSAMITHALESAIGRAGAIHLAAGVDGVHGLAGALGADVARAPRSEGGRIAVPTRHGLGIAPDRRFLALHRAPEALTSGELREQRDAIPHPLESAALARPDHIALRCANEALTFAALRDRAARGAAVLKARGIAPGTTVALEGPHDARFVSWMFAVSWLGAAVAPLPTELRPDERRQLLAAIAPAAVLDSATPFDHPSALPERFWPPSETRLVIATSGTTGAPRAIALSTNQLVSSAFGSAIRLGHALDDRWLCCLPLHHISGASILFRCALYATSCVLEPRFDAARCAAMLDGSAVSLVSLVPSMLARVLDARPAGATFPATLRAILVGGAAMPSELRDRCRAISAPLALTWGMTEAASQVATALPGDLRDGAVGPPLPFARIAEREDGLLEVRGPLVRGSLTSGDRGRVLENGSVAIDGRADDVIISGGVNIAPSEIEDLLRRHPAVGDAAVVAMPSKRWGARPWAAVVPTPGAAEHIDEAALRAWCREHVAPYKAPDRIFCCEGLPRTALGKISKDALRAMLDEMVTQPEPKARR